VPCAVRVRVEIMGSQKCRTVGKSQSVLMIINPIIFTRTRMSCAVVTARRGHGTWSWAAYHRVAHHRDGCHVCRCVRQVLHKQNETIKRLTHENHLLLADTRSHGKGSNSDDTDAILTEDPDEAVSFGLHICLEPLELDCHNRC
jgi:hypothetical protein